MLPGLAPPGAGALLLHSPSGQQQRLSHPSTTSPSAHIAQHRAGRSPGMPCSRPCWGSHPWLYNPAIATSTSKTLLCLLPLTYVFAMEDSWMLCLFFISSLKTFQTAGAVSCRDPASRTGHGIPPSFNCCSSFPHSAHPRLIQGAHHLVFSCSKTICTFTSQKQVPCYPRAELHCSNQCESHPSLENLRFPWSHTAQFTVHHITAWLTGEIWPWVLISSALYKALSFPVQLVINSGIIWHVILSWEKMWRETHAFPHQVKAPVPSGLCIGGIETYLRTIFKMRYWSFLKSTWQENIHIFSSIRKKTNWQITKTKSQTRHLPFSSKHCQVRWGWGWVQDMQLCRGFGPLSLFPPNSESSQTQRNTETKFFDLHETLRSHHKEQGNKTYELEILNYS